MRWKRPVSWIPFFIMKAKLEKSALPAVATPLPEYQPQSFGGGFAGVSEAPPSYYAQLVWRYRWQILTLVMFVTTVVALVVFSLHPQYSATAILRIDQNGMQTVGQNNRGANGMPLSASSLIHTEASEITSPAVILRTVRNLQLYDYREFNPKNRPGSPVPSNVRLLKIADVVKGGISVSHPSSTYLLNVSYRSLDPNLSASIANGLLQSLIQQDYQTRVNALLGASTSMRSQLVALRARMERAQAALVQYESQKDVLDPDSANNIMMASLTQVNNDLGLARAQRILYQSLYDVVSSGDINSILVTKPGAQLFPLEQQLLQDRARLARMALVYGPKFPVFRQQQAVVKNDQALLERQRRQIADQIQSQYDSALAREKLLKHELIKQKQQMDLYNLKAIRYHSLQAAAQSYTKLYYELQEKIQDAGVAANLKAENLRIISPAHAIDTPVYPRKFLAIAVSFFLSAFLGIAGALVLGILDSSVTTAEQIENLFHLPLLAALPQLDSKEQRLLRPFGYGTQASLTDSGQEASSLPAHVRHGSPFREGILALHSAIMLAHDRVLRTLAVTSALPSEGKSTITANLAAALAGMGSRVVLVDADMRKPSTHHIFQMPNRKGLSTLLRGHATLEQVILEIPHLPNLFLVPAGSASSSPAELLNHGLSPLLEELQAKFDYVVFDCPPILGFADSLSITNQTDGCLLVVSAGHTDRTVISGALRQLRSVRASILGIVLNNVSREVNKYYSYYSTYKHYAQYSEEDADSAAAGSPS